MGLILVQLHDSAIELGCDLLSLKHVSRLLDLQALIALQNNCFYRRGLWDDSGESIIMLVYNYRYIVVKDVVINLINGIWTTNTDTLLILLNV